MFIESIYFIVYIAFYIHYIAICLEQKNKICFVYFWEMIYLRGLLILLQWP